MFLTRLKASDMQAAARVHRAAFDERLPWLAGMHTPQEDHLFFRDHLFASCEMWGSFNTNELVAILALRRSWIDQLYVLPPFQAKGVGKALLAEAKKGADHLQLWTFQRNHLARGFYERQGFCVVRETNGGGNEEKEPDVLYEWRR